MTTFFECRGTQIRKETIMSGLNEKAMSFIKDRLGETKVRPVAIACGLNPNIVGKWLREERSPTLKNAGTLLDYLGARLQLPDEESVEYAYINKVKALAGAGSSLVTSGDISGSMPFRKSFLLQHGLHAASCILIDVMGDSMEPLLRTGDTIMVDTSDTNVVDGKIYLVAVGEELVVKRLQKMPNGLLLRSDNPIYADIPVSSAEIGSSAVIHGRVRWCSKMM